VAKDSPRTRLAVDVRREQLLDVGITLFAEFTYEEVSIEEIATACGVSRGLLYHYFRGKRKFYVATIRHAAERIGDIDPDPKLPPTEQLRTGLDRYFASVENDALAHAAVRRAAADDPEIAEIMAEQRAAFAERVLAGLPAATHAGASPLAALTARAWIGAVEAAARLWLDRPEVARADLVAVLSDALVAAILAAARRDPSIEIPAEILSVFGDGVAEAVHAKGA
jgi:AcrR family transcriptional regulator